MTLRKIIISFLALLSLASCDRKPAEDANKKAIAKAGNEYLYSDEIQKLVPKGTSSKDSVELINKFIDNWVREALVIQKAENNLSEEPKNVDKQLKEYRNSLITYAYEKELVKQKLDTNVTNDDIEKYYNSNQKDFQLKDNIIKVIYVKVKKNAPNITKLKALYKSDNPKDREQLAGYCHQFAQNFYLDDNSWLLFDDLMKEIPIQTYNKELFLQNNRFVEVSDSLSSYFVNIKGFKIRNSTSPLSFEKENIKNIILNKRKLELISKMKLDVYNEAANNNKVEIYINDKKKK
jgi:hypothetical protein